MSAAESDTQHPALPASKINHSAPAIIKEKPPIPNSTRYDTILKSDSILRRLPVQWSRQRLLSYLLNSDS